MASKYQPFVDSIVNELAFVDLLECLALANINQDGYTAEWREAIASRFRNLAEEFRQATIPQAFKEGPPTVPPADNIVPPGMRSLKHTITDQPSFLDGLQKFLRCCPDYLPVANILSAIATEIRRRGGVSTNDFSKNQYQVRAMIVENAVALIDRLGGMFRKAPAE